MSELLPTSDDNIIPWIALNSIYGKIKSTGGRGNSFFLFESSIRKKSFFNTLNGNIWRVWILIATECAKPVIIEEKKSHEHAYMSQ